MAEFLKTIWRGPDSKSGVVLVVRYMRDGRVEFEEVDRALAPAVMYHDPRNGNEVVSAKILWGDEIDVYS